MLTRKSTSLYPEKIKIPDSTQTCLQCLLVLMFGYGTQQKALSLY